ncbi:O-methyltransferase [Novosphingobium terrae]|uniref:O-methyltransferase n=1 Tax=Novosphingobium terrae TaxID=2726189 RepID=UPI001981D1B8|nr:class I SAM-dependent methyltransferase [Novosphingobium terrae]
MDSLTSGRIAETLERLHREADQADQPYMDKIMAEIGAPGSSLEDVVATHLAEERADYHGTYRTHAEHFLAVSPAYGRFLYMCVRASGARRIVEFGTSMGLSTIYLAAGLRDNGGGTLIGSDLEASKVARARANLEAAGLADLVEIRQGDALETLRDVGGTVDLLLLDGAFSLYLDVLKLVEPHLRSGAFVLAENAFEPGYLAHIRNPANGYLSQAVALDEGRGNELAVVTR